MHGEIHNRHREGLENITAADRGRTESFLESSSLREVSRGFLSEGCLQPMMLKAYKTKAQVLYHPDREEALEERKKIKKEGREENRFDSWLLQKDNTNSTGNHREQLLPKARHGEAQEGFNLLMSRSTSRKGLIFPHLKTQEDGQRMQLFPIALLFWNQLPFPRLGYKVCRPYTLTAKLQIPELL